MSPEVKKQVARDLERKFVEKLSELYEREINIMVQVLDYADIGSILIRAVSGSVLTTGATVANTAKDEIDPATVYDLVIEQVFAKVRKERGHALDLVRSKRNAAEQERRS